ncbi:Pleckstrin homology-like domain [Ceraceosorus bombacis]|uniref:Pleckstrin homology-like domain n=1 Tax=Ceraceosorus bombacis TaxID=401625 RepID=A0A0P1BP66_9BASI|nr:Pleckstrin homology-like domain [Ceraceosorus bombacis]
MASTSTPSSSRIPVDLTQNQPHRRPHHFRRIYLGPTPVSSNAAASLAAAIAEDATVDEPLGLGVAKSEPAAGGTANQDIVEPLLPPHLDLPPTSPPHSHSRKAIHDVSGFVRNRDDPFSSEVEASHLARDRVRELAGDREEELGQHPSSGPSTLRPPRSREREASSERSVSQRRASPHDLSPLTVSHPGIAHSTSQAARNRQQLAREASAVSFASAKSLPDSVLSEGDALARARKGKGKLDESQDALHFEDINGWSKNAEGGASWGRSARDRKRIGSVEGELDDHVAQQAKRRLSFDLPEGIVLARRGRSESAAAGSHLREASEPPLALLDVSLAEADETIDHHSETGTLKAPSVRNGSLSQEATPRAESAARLGLLHQLHAIDHATPLSKRTTGSLQDLALGRKASDRSLSTFKGSAPRRRRSKNSLRHIASASGSLTRYEARRLSKASVGSQHDADASVHDPTSPSSFRPNEEIEDASPFERRLPKQRDGSRARAHIAAEATYPPRRRSASYARGHPREFSRASKMSRASTVGTLGSFGSHGTRFTEGSFGATGGFRAKLVAFFGSRSSAASARESAARRRSASFAALARGKPGQVGTSAGGTKWVGGSFEVGRRFQEVLNARHAVLGASLLDHASGDSASVKDSSRKEQRPERDGATRDPQLKHTTDNISRSPSDVLSTFAHQAQDSAGDKQVNGVGQTDGKLADDTFRKAELTVTEASPAQDESTESTTRPMPSGKETINEKLRNASDTPNTTPTKRRPMDSSNSAVSLLSVPHTKGADHESQFTIESRHGWSDVVSFMSANSSLGSDNRVASPAFGSMAERSRRALENGLGSIEAFRARQAERRAARKDLGPALSRDAIREASTSSGTDVSLSQAALGKPASQMKGSTTHNLLRRQSFQGVRADGVKPETASDHEVVIQGTPTSAGDRAPEVIECRALSTAGSTLLGSETAVADNRDPRLRTVSTLSGDTKAYAGSHDSRTHTPKKAKGPQDLGVVCAGQMYEPALNSTVDVHPSPRKTVQFEGGARPNVTGRSLSTSLFTRNGPNAEVKLTPSANGKIARPPSGATEPVPPEEVLSRPGSFENRRSTPVHSGSTTPTEAMTTPRSELKRDRMLVKIGWTPSADLPADLDENSARKYAVYSDPWREYMVVLRHARLEIWDDPTFMSKATGHASRLDLHQIVPLRRGSTCMSLFSPVDRIFAIHYQHDVNGHRGKLHLRRSPTHVLLFDTRARSVATDWMWEIWRELGGLIPESLDVHIPALDGKVRIPVPDEVPCHSASSVQALELPGNGQLVMHSPGSVRSAGEGFKLISRNNLVRTTLGLVLKQSDWKDLVEVVFNMGLQFELAWRHGTTLDWITESTTVQGDARDWAVLSGSVLRQASQIPALELRAGMHYPTNTTTADGRHIEEPPAVEGYLWRVKPVSGALTRIYVTTHDGHIFVCRPSRAFPPDRHLATGPQKVLEATAFQRRPLPRRSQDSRGAQQRTRKRDKPRRALDKVLGRDKRLTRDESMDELREQVMSTAAIAAAGEDAVTAQRLAYQAFERRRQFEQISKADGYVDLRDMRVIRCVGTGHQRRPSTDLCADPHELPKEGAEAVKLAAREQDPTLTERHDPDVVEEEAPALSPVQTDVGGEEGLAAAADRNALRRSRQFEVVMANGRTTRFEAYSASIAKEWVERLACLAQYWKRREKADAIELMHVSGYNPSMMRKRRGRHHDEDAAAGEAVLGQEADSDHVSPLLGTIWNWCMLEGCRGIIRAGRLFHKRKAYTSFSSRYYILIAGRLLSYKIVTSHRTARDRQNAGIFHKRQETVVHLRDAYVYSGKLTEEMLTNGRTEGAGAVSGGNTANVGERHRLPRVYRDGLLTVDEDEDCTMVVRYRPQRLQHVADPHSHVQPRDGAAVNIAGMGTSMTTNSATVDHATQPAVATAVPMLGDASHNHLVLRARCKLERDLWVHAISCEIERLVRQDKEREDRLRLAGKTPYKPNR